ncbi:hypothetical protein SUGI_0032840 [Cryptomeria japonica]|nr:hypothetical protein SUGI_0032840 [Cryptomeria japonica]
MVSKSGSDEDHINSTVVPALREKEDEFLLTEFVKQWEFYNRLVRLLLHPVFYSLLLRDGSLKWPSHEDLFSKHLRYFPEMVLNECKVQAAMLVQIH